MRFLARLSQAGIRGPQTEFHVLDNRGIVLFGNHCRRTGRSKAFNLRLVEVPLHQAEHVGCSRVLPSEPSQYYFCIHVGRMIAYD